MEPPICEVIGCGHPACYVLVGEQDGTHEDYLCERCFRALDQNPTHPGALYLLLTEYPALYPNAAHALRYAAEENSHQPHAAF